MNFSNKKDRLLSEIAAARSSKQKITLMNDLAMVLCQTDPEEAVTVSREALRLSEAALFKVGIARSHFSEGMAFLTMSGVEPAFQSFYRALEAYRQANDKWGESNALNNLGILFQRIGDYGKALDCYSEAIRIKEESGDQYGTCNVHISLSGMYREAGGAEAAKQEIEQALKTAGEIHEVKLLSKALLEQGMILIDLNESSAAQQSFTSAQKLFAEQNNLYGLTQSLLMLGRVSRELGQIEEGREYLHQALQKSREAGEIYSAGILYELAALESDDGNRQELLIRAEEAAEKSNERPVLCRICEELSTYYEKTGAFEPALHYFRKAHRLKSEMNMSETAARLKNMEISRRVDLLEREKKMLEVEKMAALGQLTAGVAHEINNPVNFVAANISPVRRNIQDILSVLRRCEEMINELGLEDKRTELKRLREEHDLDYTIEELDRLLLGIDNGASRIRDIVAGLRTFTHHDEAEYKPADIHEGFNATLTLLGGKIRSEIRVIKEFGAVDSFAHFPSLLNQAFMHLILNAAEAIEGPGEIRIKTSSSPDQVVVIEVTDTGKGMSDAVRRKAFEPFFTTKDVGGGAGLGLAVTKNIVDRHNGRIEVDSLKGKGTTVRILLPAGREQPS